MAEQSSRPGSGCRVVPPCCPLGAPHPGPDGHPGGAPGPSSGACDRGLGAHLFSPRPARARCLPGGVTPPGWPPHLEVEVLNPGVKP